MPSGSVELVDLVEFIADLVILGVNCGRFVVSTRCLWKCRVIVLSWGCCGIWEVLG